MNTNNNSFNEEYFEYHFDTRLHYVADEIKPFKHKNNKVNALVQSFIASFEPIEFGFFTVGFTKRCKFAIIPRKKRDLLDLHELNGEDDPLGPVDKDEYQKDVAYFTNPRKWDDSQWLYVSLWDYVTAYQLKAKICGILGTTLPTPKFEFALENMSKTDADGYLTALAPYLPPQK